MPPWEIPNAEIPKSNNRVIEKRRTNLCAVNNFIVLLTAISSIPVKIKMTMILREITFVSSFYDKNHKKENSKSSTTGNIKNIFKLVKSN